MLNGIVIISPHMVAYGGKASCMRLYEIKINEDE
jgi:hypothetical protein